jgi:hypothetical protein
VPLDPTLSDQSSDFRARIELGKNRVQLVNQIRGRYPAILRIHGQLPLGLAG